MLFNYILNTLSISNEWLLFTNENYINNDILLGGSMIIVNFLKKKKKNNK